MHLIHLEFKLSDLEQYPILAWDFDDTLVDQEHSYLFFDYIMNHQNQKHVIVTHRSHGWQNMIGIDFERFHGEKATISIIKEVYACPDDLFGQYQAGTIILPDEYNQFYNWKGQICRKIGAGALIDDNIDHCAKGCELAGVNFYYAFGVKP